MSDERATKQSPSAAFCSESVATIDTVKRPYCPRNPCAFFAALQGKRCAMVNHRGVGGNGLWHCQESSHAIHRPEIATEPETTMRAIAGGDGAGRGRIQARRMVRR